MLHQLRCLCLTGNFLKRKKRKKEKWMCNLKLCERQRTEGNEWDLIDHTIRPYRLFVSENINIDASINNTQSRDGQTAVSNKKKLKIGNGVSSLCDSEHAVSFRFPITCPYMRRISLHANTDHPPTP